MTMRTTVHCDDEDHCPDATPESIALRRRWGPLSLENDGSHCPQRRREPLSLGDEGNHCPSEMMGTLVPPDRENECLCARPSQAGTIVPPEWRRPLPCQIAGTTMPATGAWQKTANNRRRKLKTDVASRHPRKAAKRILTKGKCASNETLHDRRKLRGSLLSMGKLVEHSLRHKERLELLRGRRLGRGGGTARRRRAVSRMDRGVSAGAGRIVRGHIGTPQGHESQNTKIGTW